MFRRITSDNSAQITASERVTSVLGPGINWQGNLRGSGGVRIEGTFEGDIALRGLVVVGETGRVTCDTIKANTLIVAGSVRGDVTAEKLEIRSTGRVWGDVVTTSFSTEEGAFLRGQVRMEEQIEIEIEPSESLPTQTTPEGLQKVEASKPPPEAVETPDDGIDEKTIKVNKTAPVGQRKNQKKAESGSPSPTRKSSASQPRGSRSSRSTKTTKSKPKDEEKDS